MRLSETVSGSSARAWTLDAELETLGYDFFTGVPCSLVAPFYDVLAERGRDYYPATREDLALGLAAGAALTGRKPVVVMQNSGLGHCGNVLLSLHSMYELPALLIVTWRGYGADAPEHIETGRRTPQLLEDFSVPSRLLADNDAFEPDFHAARTPVALLVRPRDLA